MRLNWNYPGLAIIVALTVATAGCGGINASHTVSPATFFLPGLMRADSMPTNTLAAAPANLIELALAR